MMSEEIKSLETTQLVDLLAHYTSEYYHLAGIGANEKEWIKCKMMIETIQEEIISRNKTEQQTFYSHHHKSIPPEKTL